MISLSDIKKIFVPKAFPTADQFWNTFSSFWHKSEKLPIEQILGLKEEIDKVTTKFKGYHTNLVKLQTEYPQADNKKDFFAWVGTPYPGTVYKVYTDGGAWTDTGEVPTQQEIDLTEYAKQVDVAKKADKTVIYNVSIANNNYAYTDKTTARNAVVSTLRGLGQIITYKLTTGWINEQYIGTDVNGWGTESNWEETGALPDTIVLDDTNDVIDLSAYLITTSSRYIDVSTGKSTAEGTTTLTSKFVEYAPLKAGTYKFSAQFDTAGNAAYKKMWVFNTAKVLQHTYTLSGTYLEFTLSEDSLITFITYQQPSGAYTYDLGAFEFRLLGKSKSLLFTDGTIKRMGDLDVYSGQIIARSDYPVSTIQGTLAAGNVYYANKNTLLTAPIGRIDVNCMANSVTTIAAIDPTAKTAQVLGTITAATAGVYTINLGGVQVDNKYIAFKSTVAPRVMPHGGRGMVIFNTDNSINTIYEGWEVLYYIYDWQTERIEDITEDNALQLSELNNDRLISEGLANAYEGTAMISDTGVSNIYVRNAGSDTNAGTSAAPVKTIAKAVELAKASVNPYVIIHLNAPEEYRLTGTVTIDYGKDIRFVVDNPNIGKPYIKGSKLIASSDFTSMGDGIYRLAVTKKDYQFVIVNGKMVLPASTTRVPYDVMTFKGTLPTLPGTTLVNEKGREFNWITLSSADIAKITLDTWVTIFNVWLSFKSKVIEIDTAGNRIKVAGTSIHGKSYIGNGNRMIIENNPNSFAFDANSVAFPKGTFYSTGGYLYYKLKDGETIAGIKFELPDVETFFNIKGKTGFSKVIFEGSYYNLFNDLDGKSCQDRQSGYNIPASINCYAPVSFYDCEYSKFGQNVVQYKNGSHDCEMLNCYIHDTGCSSVYLGEIDSTTTNPARNIRIDNCVIHDIGKVLQQSTGMPIGYVQDCEIINNDISRTHYTGITMGYSWRDETTPTALKRNRIANNYVHHCGNFVLNDMGGIYILGDTSNSVMENNVIHDVHPFDKSLAACIYLDESVNNMHVRNNIAYGAPLNVLLHWNHYNKLYNNIFAYYLKYAFHVANTQGMSTLSQNIVFSDNSSNVFQYIGARAAFNRNLYYNKSSAYAVIANDLNAKTGNPNFNNPSRGDFTITDTTNTDLIDFQVFTDKAGVRGEMVSKATISEAALSAFRLHIKTQYGTTSELYNW